MTIELKVTLDSLWAESKYMDNTDVIPPMRALILYIKQMRSAAVISEEEHSCIVSLDMDSTSVTSFRARVTQFLRRRFPADDIRKVLRIEPTGESSDQIPSESSFRDIMDDFFGDEEDAGQLMPDPMEKISALIGAEEFKALAEECVRVAPGLIKHNIVDTFTRQCYLFAINDGEGLSTYLQLFADLLTYNKLMSVVGDRRIIEINVTGKDDTGIKNACSAVTRAKTGGKILCIDISECMTMLHEPRFRGLWECINEDATKNIVVFRVPFVEDNVLSGIKKALSDIFTVRGVSMVPFDTQELLRCAGDELERRGYQISEDAKDILCARIVEEKSDGRFYGINTINKIVREMIYLKQLSNSHTDTDDLLIKKEEILPLSSSYFMEEKGGLELLDDYIGMENIKSRVEEIVLQIEVALQNPKLGSPCIHMRFVGNPGTGKTTVARVIGKILKERGILRKGNFFEHTGRDFCGRYVGETAPKAAAMCRDAYGSVLFIDEAYTLYRSGASTVDFGREAIDTLIAEMENHRSDLVVIMAGYTDEMDTLMQANPGLESRMPFVIEFPNYTRQQLRDIFMSMVENNFSYAQGLEKVVEAYFLDLPEELLHAKEFSNARFVRNLFERTWGKAGVRCKLNHATDIVIAPEDFLAATSEKEFSKLMTKKTRTLGFV